MKRKSEGEPGTPFDSRFGFAVNDDDDDDEPVGCAALYPVHSQSKPSLRASGMQRTSFPPTSSHNESPC